MLLDVRGFFVFCFEVVRARKICFFGEQDEEFSLLTLGGGAEEMRINFGLPRGGMGRSRQECRSCYENTNNQEFACEHDNRLQRLQPVVNVPYPADDPRFIGFARMMEAGDDFMKAMDRSDFIAAEGVCREMERTGNECAYLFFNKAFVCRATDRKEESVALYRRALKLDPDVEMLWMRYGETCEELSDRAEAIRAYHEARRILPKHQEATLALERLKELFRISMTAKPDELLWVTKEELRALSEKDVQQRWQNVASLRSYAGEMLRTGHFPDLALRALKHCDELDPQNAEGLRNLGVALRLNGCALESLDPLREAGALDRTDAWAMFHLAESHVVLGQIDDAWELLDAALKCDCNHQGALRLKFLNRDDRTTEQKEQDLATYSQPRGEDWIGSWRGFILAANSAWRRGAHKPAVKFAGEAYKIAPDEEEVFLTYTGMLSECGEYEWVAALTKPRLRAREKNPRAWMNFARALDALGLRDEAVVTLQQALAELKLSDDDAQPITAKLDVWTGRFAASEIGVELHPGGDALRRNICQVRDAKVVLRIFEAGMSLPNHRELPVTFTKPCIEFDFTVEQRNAIADDDPSPASLLTPAIVLQPMLPA